MNRDCFRLKFCRRVGQRVPVAEHVRAADPASPRLRRPLLVSAMVSGGLLAGASLALANPALPVPAAVFVSAGSAAAPVVSGSTMTIQTQSAATVLNYQSFNIGAGNTVRIEQPSSVSRAINRVLPGGPRSDIYGSLQSNGQVFLINQAGVLFGPGARVDVAGLVATSLKMSDELVERGLSSFGATSSAFFRDGEAGDVVVQQGARIVAAQGGRILLAAPNVSNAGTLINVEGQTILAAGEKLYLADPLDSRLRGFLVEVDGGGLVSNEAAGRLLSERGNITLVGQNVRHAGEARATTAVTLNGTIFLKARDTVSARDADRMFPDIAAIDTSTEAPIPVGTETGTVELAAGSVIEIRPETESTQTLRDDAVFRPSEVNIYGRRIIAEDAEAGEAGAAIVASAGLVRLTATSDVLGVDSRSVRDDDARVYLGKGALIDVSGLEGVRLAADHDIIEVELRGDELKDSPVLRDPAYGRDLVGEKIYLDSKQGTRLADVSAYFGAIERTVAERSTVGGAVEIFSQGDVLAHRDSMIDVSGGTVDYLAGEITRSILTSQAGGRFFAEDALGNRPYTGDVIQRTVKVAARTEGRDAGSVTVSAFGAVLDGSLDATRTVGPDQLAIRVRNTGPNSREVIGAPRAGVVAIELLREPGSAPMQAVDFVNGMVARSISALTSLVSQPLLLSSDWFSSGGIGDFRLSGAGAVSLPASVQLQLPATAHRDEDGEWSDGARFRVSGTRIAIDGGIAAPGGRIAFRAQDVVGGALDAEHHAIKVGSAAVLTTAGRWINDVPNGPAGYRVYSGGWIQLEAEGSLWLATGALLDVSAGAWMNANRAVALGEAGRLALLSGEIPGATMMLAGRLAGYGVRYGQSVSDGGTLEIDTRRLRLAQLDSNDGQTLVLGRERFTADGFSHFDLTGRAGVEVGDGAPLTIRPEPLARTLGGRLSRQASRDDVSWSVLTASERAWRGATSLALTASSLSEGVLRVASGSRLEVDAGGRIELAGNTSIDIAGSVLAPGGEIAIGMREPSFGEDYLGATIRLLDGARVDASGTLLARMVDGRQVGAVLDGGTIDINARRGYLLADAGAEIRSDGSRGALHLPEAGSGRIRLSEQASNGGAIQLAAREGLFIDSVLSARAGGSDAVGGSLTVSLDHGSADWFNVSGLPLAQRTALSGMRSLTVFQQATGTATQLATNAPDPALLAGRGEIGAATISAGGFRDLTLRAAGRASSNSQLRFSEDVELRMPGTLVLDTPNIVGTNGASARFFASALAWVNTSGTTQTRALPPTVMGGDGLLSLTAGQIDVVGNVAASRFSEVMLNATHDLRLTGVAHDVDPDSAVTDTRVRGSLVSAGNITLSAAQIYPTTRSEFAVEIHNNPNATLTTAWSGQLAGVPLSAGGALTLAAPKVHHGGVLRAPFGSLDLLAEEIVRVGQFDVAQRTPSATGEVRLLDGSLTSVAADGALIPFGATRVSGREWIYAQGGGNVETVASLPERSVTLRGASLVSEEGALVDVSGGGDVLAAEWIPGVGGSADILAGGGERYAIVPAAGLHGAPFDQSLAGINGFSAPLIDVLGSGNGLTAGAYVLLPARYAVLPGAYLVSLRRDIVDPVASQAVVQADGGVLLAARDAYRMDGASVATGRRFAVEVLTSTQAAKRAEYLLTKGSDFFSADPDDAGRLSLQVGSTLDFLGTLRAQTSGRGPQVDITATQLAILGMGQTALAGEVGVDAGLIGRFGADSLLLGGVRGALNDQGERLVQAGDDVFGARTVRVATAEGTALSAAEVVVMAREAVTIEAGSRIEASGEHSPEVLRIVGSGEAADGAMLRLAAGDADAARRDAPARTQGVLTLGVGAVLSGKSVVLDATRETINHGATFALGDDGQMTLTGSRISVGETAGVDDGLVFSNEQLSGLGTPARLRLKSYSTLDLYGEVALGYAGLGQLIIDAAGVVGRENSGIVQRIDARSVSFTNSNDTAPEGAVFNGAGTGGTLRVSAETVSFGETPDAFGGQQGFSFQGYDLTQVEATGAVRLEGRGHVGIQGDATMRAPVVVAATGARQALVVAGHLDLSSAGSAASDVIASAGLGAAFDLQAQSMRIDTRMVLPAGRISARATGADAASGSLEIAEGARLEAVGIEREVLDIKVAVPAGTVVLSSEHGNVSIRDGARIDVSGAGKAEAGSVALSAAEGFVDVAAGSLLAAPGETGERGGALSVDVLRLASIDALAAASSDFTAAWALRVRAGDVRLSDSASIVAADIDISADAGSLGIDGTLDASGDKGGSIVLAARRAVGYTGEGEGAGNVELGADAFLDARASEYLAAAFGTRGEGGSVVLDASPAASGGTVAAPQGGRIRIADGARIDVGTAAKDGTPSAARGGLVTLRAERLGGTGLGIDVLPADAITGARAIHVEGTQVRTSATLDMAAAHTANNTFMSTANLAQLRAALGIDGADPRWHIRPHVEYRSSGDFTISADENLNARRYVSNAEAGSLTIRAAGNILVNGSLSDGFSTATTAGLLQSQHSGWNITLAAGADTGAAAAASLRSADVLVAEGKGDLRLAANKFVRTGAGSIEAFAGRDIVLGVGATLYSAGVADVPGDLAFTNATRVSGGSPASRAAEYPTNGGDVTLRAAGSVLAAQSNQLVSQWLYRQGSVDADGSIPTVGSATQLRNLTWYPRFDQFAHGVATFGGGDVVVDAGGDILNLGVAAASNGRLFGAQGSQPDLANLVVLGGGDIRVRAGGDIGSPVFYAGRGMVDVEAGGGIGNSRSTTPLGAVVALGEASVRLRAAGDILLQGVTSATLMRQVTPNGAALTDTSRLSYFSTLASDSAVDVLSFGGAVDLLNANPQNVGNVALFLNQPLLAPSTLSLVALGGDVTVHNAMVMLPSPTSSLTIAARDSVVFGATVKIADTAVNDVPSVLRPVINDADPRWRALGSRSASGRAAHDAALTAARVSEPVRIVADWGDVRGPVPGTTLEASLLAPQPVWVRAGGDVRDFAIRAQHLEATDVTRIEAGGSVIFSPALSNNDLLPQSEGIVVGGQGRVEVIAGGDIDLANSYGIVTRGNFDNPFLGEQGAAILAIAGAGPFDYEALLALLRPTAAGAADLYDAQMIATLKETDIGRVLARYPQLAKLRDAERVRISAELAKVDADIVGWMRGRTGDPGLSAAEALLAFAALSATQRQDFYSAHRTALHRLLNVGLRYAGNLGKTLDAGPGGYAPGETLLKSLFPQPGDGSINVFYSQIRSEQGGAIDLLAPGGGLTVGVTGAGASTIPPARQGIFAVGEGEVNVAVRDDIQVGPSRIFTLGGGDLQLWSSIGNIDAGKGAKTAAATPPPQVRIRGDLVVLDISDAVTGSGIGTLRKSADTPAADVRIYAPAGYVDAGDAGIRSSGDIDLGGARLINADNISAGGDFSSNTVVPVSAPPTPSPAASASEADAVASIPAQSTAQSVEKEVASLLSVEILALGDDADGENEERRRRGPATGG